MELNLPKWYKITYDVINGEYSGKTFIGHLKGTSVSDVEARFPRMLYGITISDVTNVTVTLT